MIALDRNAIAGVIGTQAIGTQAIATAPACRAANAGDIALPTVGHITVPRYYVS